MLNLSHQMYLFQTRLKIFFQMLAIMLTQFLVEEWYVRWADGRIWCVYLYYPLHKPRRDKTV